MSEAWWANDKDGNPRFHWGAVSAWCFNCGTVSTNGQCPCNDPCLSQGGKPSWRPNDEQAMEFIASLRSRISDLEKALEPFAAIKPSSFYDEQGTENEHYTVMLTMNCESAAPDFTGADLFRARTVLSQGDRTEPDPAENAVEPDLIAENFPNPLESPGTHPTAHEAPEG